MSCPLQLTSWDGELNRRFPDLPATTVFVLALYSFGMILAKVSGLATVVLTLSKSLRWPSPPPLSDSPRSPPPPLRNRPRVFSLGAPATPAPRHGVKRQDFDVSTCFCPLLRWVLSLWQGRQLPLAIDVTNLGERFHVLAVSVVVKGVGIPLAWKVLPGGIKEPWNPHWDSLLRRLKPAVPAGWAGIVLSRRGLGSP